MRSRQVHDGTGKMALGGLLPATGLLAGAVVVFLWPAEVSSDAQVGYATGALPTVVSAAMPALDGPARQIGMTGSLTLRVHTDGEKAQLIVVDRAAPLLGHAAVENLKSWRFAPHRPTNFEVTFRFKAIDKKTADPCGPNRKAPWTGQDPISTIEFPTVVEVEALRDLVVICDHSLTTFEESVSRIQGTVVCRCPERRPIADADVLVEDDMRVLRRTRTDADGRFSLPSVGWGKKRISVQKHGYFSRFYQVKSLPLPWVRRRPLELELAPDPAQDLPEPRTKAFLVPTSVPLYPPDARERHIEGEVRLTLAPLGQVTSATGPAALLGPTLDAVRNWEAVSGDDASEIRFTYRLADGDCLGGGPTVTLRGHHAVEVTAKRVVSCAATGSSPQQIGWHRPAPKIK